VDFINPIALSPELPAEIVDLLEAAESLQIRM